MLGNGEVDVICDSTEVDVICDSTDTDELIDGVAIASVNRYEEA